MIAITTTYHSATNTKASYIKATTCNGHKATMPMDYALEDYELYKSAAIKLVEKEFKNQLENYELVGGGIKDGYVWVFVPKK